MSLIRPTLPLLALHHCTRLDAGFGQTDQKPILMFITRDLRLSKKFVL